MKLGFYPRLYHVQHVVVVGAEGLPLVRLDWLLGALALGVPPEGAIAHSSLLGTVGLTGEHPRRRETGPSFRPLAASLVKAEPRSMLGEARVLSPHPRPGLHRASRREHDHPRRLHRHKIRGQTTSIHCHEMQTGIRE